MLLSKLRVLTLDCQATNGQLLEVGWSLTTSSASVEIDSRLVRLTEGARLSKRVQQVTGLREDDLASGASPRRVWGLLADVARRSDFTVIHFARFEEPYLRWLHHCHAAGAPYPFRILCTHQIVTRLLPELPRRGLRAAAGYFGHPMGEHRRAADHVAATNAVWRSCVRLLGDDHGVHTVLELMEFLQAPATRRRRRSYPMAARAKQELPDKPGVYRMLRARGDVLYVGKASSLRGRVRSYFAPGTNHAEHTLEMLSQARDVDVTVTSSAVEAALLEVEEIHRLHPPYNKAFRAGQRSLVFANAGLDSFRESADATHRVGPLPATDIWAEWAEASRGRVAPLACGALLWRAGEDEEEFRLEASFPTLEQRRDEVLRRGSHLVRRAHWFRLIHGANAIWAGGTVSTPEGAWNVVAYDRLVVLTRELRRLLNEGQRPVLETGRARLDAKTLERLLRWV